MFKRLMIFAAALAAVLAIAAPANASSYWIKLSGDQSRLCNQWTTFTSTSNGAGQYVIFQQRLVDSNTWRTAEKQRIPSSGTNKFSFFAMEGYYRVVMLNSANGYIVISNTSTIFITDNINCY